MAQRAVEQRYGLGIVSVIVFAVALIDAMVHPVAFFDRWLIVRVQNVTVPGLETVLRVVDQLTSSEGAVAAWLVVLLALLAARWWIPALIVFALPIGGLANEFVARILVTRPRPHGVGDWLLRGSTNPEPHSFPSGHVTGAVMLYGLLFFLANRLRHAPPRWATKAICVVVIAVVGFDRVYIGAHWPTDVIAAYALGGALLALLLAAQTRLIAWEASPAFPSANAAAIMHGPDWSSRLRATLLLALAALAVVTAWPRWRSDLRRAATWVRHCRSLAAP